MASVAIRDAQKAFGVTRVIHGVNISIRDFVRSVGRAGLRGDTMRSEFVHTPWTATSFLARNYFYQRSHAGSSPRSPLEAGETGRA